MQTCLENSFSFHFTAILKIFECLKTCNGIECETRECGKYDKANHDKHTGHPRRQNFLHPAYEASLSSRNDICVTTRFASHRTSTNSILSS